MSAARCQEHAHSRRIHDDCDPCGEAMWAKEVAPFVKPSESLASFKTRWRRHMLGFVGLTPRAAMPSVQTDAQFAAEIRRHGQRRIVTAFDAQHRPPNRRDLGTWSMGGCACVDCQRDAWERAVTDYAQETSAAA